MTTNFNRRGFGLLALSAACLPKLGFAEGFVEPGLLEQPETLMGHLPSSHVLIDLRPIEDYLSGHIPGARHLDANAVAATDSPVDGALRPMLEIEAMLADLGVAPSTRVVFYDDRGGFHAARMFWLMEYLGHRDVAVLNGGWTTWQSVGGAFTTEIPSAITGGFVGAPSPRKLASADYILERKDDADTLVVDVRPTDLFSKGHIPWATNVPWSKNLDGKKRFKSADDLRTHFEALGVTSDRNVVLHCQNGLASAHSYVALRLLGYPRVRVYHRSWAEWGSDPALPKAVG